MLYCCIRIGRFFFLIWNMCASFKIYVCVRFGSSRICDVESPLLFWISTLTISSDVFKTALVFLKADNFYFFAACSWESRKFQSHDSRKSYNVQVLQVCVAMAMARAIATYVPCSLTGFFLGLWVGNSRFWR